MPNLGNRAAWRPGEPLCVLDPCCLPIWKEALFGPFCANHAGGDQALIWLAKQVQGGKEENP